MKRIQAEGSVLGAFGATAASLTLLVMWAAELRPGWLATAATALLAGVALLAHHARRHPDSIRSARVRRGEAALGAAMALLLAGIGGAAVAAWQFQRTERHWDATVESRQAALGSELARRMDVIVERSLTAARRAADMASARAGIASGGAARRGGSPPVGAATPAQPMLASAEAPATAVLFRQLEAVRTLQQIDAIAIYTDAGNVVAWSGRHRGALPDSIWIRHSGAYFEERPLFSYLYFSVPVPGRSEYAIAAALVETGILTESGEVSLANVVGRGAQARASFRRGGSADAAWALVVDGDTVVSARLAPPRQREFRRNLDTTARRAVLAVIFAAFVLLTFAWFRAAEARGWAATLPLLLAVGLAAAAPFGDALGAERLFSPLLFTAQLGRDLSLGRVIAVLLPLAALVVGARPGNPPAVRLGWRLALGAVVIAISYPLALRVLLDGATPALLEGGSPFWLALQFAAVLALGLVTFVLLPRLASAEPGRYPWLRTNRRRALLAAALVIAVLLAVNAMLGAHPAEPMHLSGAAWWALPFGLAGAALAPVTARTGTIMRWLVAGALAGTAVLPHLWVAHLGARLDAAEGELETLGTRSDPYLEFLLVNFGREAVARHAAGEEGVQLLYRTWVASGLAQEPYPAHIVYWSAEGLPEVQLGPAPSTTAHEVERLLEIVDASRDQAAPAITPFTDLPNMSRLLTVPMPDGSLITVRVPPRRSLDQTSAITSFLGGVTPTSTRLNLVEMSGPEPERESIEWALTPTGWRSEAIIKYPDGWYHAHLSIVLPSIGVLLARGTLLLTFGLLLFTLIWVAGVAARGRSAVPGGDWTGWLGSFRARVTLALFGFFLVPTAVFGWVAYSALAGEVARAAQIVAQHSVAQAVLEFQEGAGDLRDLAAHAGTDVLRFQGGELIDASSREALELGIYDAWLPPQVHQRLESGEDVDALETQMLGSHSYVTAYRALRPSGTLAVPMSLSAGDTALRQRQFAHLVLFAAVMGALLSLALSLAVGRALAGPIALLRRASAAVGAGTLRVRLPERAGDEFGQLFASFNRMTRRLRRARARELRTARVLAWGEMARQVAHEIKNPLTPIKLSVQHLRRAHADRHPQFEEILEANVEQVLSEIDRLSEIARAFSRYGAPSLDSGPLLAVDAPAVIRESLMLYRSGDRHVRYREEVQPGLPQVRARPNELKEVLLNLVENSRAAFGEDGGEITIRAVHLDERIEIAVADNGPGIPAEFLPRIFEPHFSTRSSGTGLGLAIVRRLVESWEGTVSAESDAGRGTVVTLRLLPAEAPHAPAPAL